MGNVLSPGPVIKQHAKFESNCGNCHKRFDKAAQPGMCRRCHKEIAQDERSKRGLHGQHVAACKECHHEHKGRDISLYKIDTTTFDHAKETRYELKGGHLSEKVQCKNCHFPRKKYREVSKKCNGCHAKQDKHKGKLGKACQNCHEEKNWKTLHFDHGKTRFKVVGKHIGVKCSACHKNSTLKNAPRECNQCHKKDDKHKGQQGKKCESCHTPHSWGKTKFDHRISRFALTGLHTLVACKKCHVTLTFKDTKSDCWSCHKKEDVHMRRLGTDCETCHNTRNWRVWNFDHNKTGFKLLHGHGGLQCIGCHSTPVARIGKSAGCGTCHSNVDIHNGAYGDICGQCHTDVAWRNIKIGSLKFISREPGNVEKNKTVSSAKKTNKKKVKKKTKPKPKQP